MNIGKKAWDAYRKLNKDIGEFETLVPQEQVFWGQVGEAARSGCLDAAKKFYQVACDVLHIHLRGFAEIDYEVQKDLWDGIAEAVKDEALDLGPIAYEAFREHAVKNMPGLLGEIIFPEAFADLPSNLQEIMRKVGMVAAESDDEEDTFAEYQRLTNEGAKKNGYGDLPHKFLTSGSNGEDNEEMWFAIVDACWVAYQDDLLAKPKKYNVVLTSFRGKPVNMFCCGDNPANEEFFGNEAQANELVDKLRGLYEDCSYEIRPVA